MERLSNLQNLWSYALRASLFGFSSFLKPPVQVAFFCISLPMALEPVTWFWYYMWWRVGVHVNLIMD